MNNGKLTDVIIEENFYTDRLGFEKFSHLIVWANPNMEGTIKNVSGVANCYHSHSETQYDVFLDRRYDREWVKAEIEAQIKIHGE